MIGVERFSVRCKVPFSAGTWALEKSPTGSMVRYTDLKAVEDERDAEKQRTIAAEARHLDAVRVGHEAVARARKAEARLNSVAEELERMASASGDVPA